MPHQALTGGHLSLQENVNVQQVKQNTDMDSHEEKLHDVIIKSKIEDTKAVMKAKAREIEASKMERLQVSTAISPSCCITCIRSRVSIPRALGEQCLWACIAPTTTSQKQMAHTQAFGQQCDCACLPGVSLPTLQNSRWYLIREPGNHSL